MADGRTQGRGTGVHTLGQREGPILLQNCEEGPPTPTRAHAPVPPCVNGRGARAGAITRASTGPKGNGCAARQKGLSGAISTRVRRRGRNARQGRGGTIAARVAASWAQRQRRAGICLASLSAHAAHRPDQSVTLTGSIRYRNRTAETHPFGAICSNRVDKASAQGSPPTSPRVSQLPGSTVGVRVA